MHSLGFLPGYGIKHQIINEKLWFRGNCASESFPGFGQMSPFLEFLLSSREKLWFRGNCASESFPGCCKMHPYLQLSAQSTIGGFQLPNDSASPTSSYCDLLEKGSQKSLVSYCPNSDCPIEKCVVRHSPESPNVLHSIFLETYFPGYPRCCRIS